MAWVKKQSAWRVYLPCTTTAPLVDTLLAVQYNPDNNLIVRAQWCAARKLTRPLESPAAC